MTDTQNVPGDGWAIRSLSDADPSAFVRFVARIPDGERRFLKEDLSDPVSALASFRKDAAARRIVLVDQGGEIAALAGVYPGSGWSAHVAEIRLVVGENFRGRGFGRVLARAALLEAVRAECSHVFVELIAEQEALVAMFQDLGFEPEALLADFVRDGDGDYRDLMVLTHRVDVNQARSALLGLTEVTA